MLCPRIKNVVAALAGAQNRFKNPLGRGKPCYYKENLLGTACRAPTILGAIRESPLRVKRFLGTACNNSK